VGRYVLWILWPIVLGLALARVFARQRVVEATLDGAIERDRTFRGSGRLVRIVPGATGIDRHVPMGTGTSGFGVMRLVALPFELRGEGFVVTVDRGAQLRVISHAAVFDGGIASLPIGTKLVLLVTLGDATTRDEPITLVDPRIDLLGHLRAIRIASRLRMAGVAAGAAALALLGPVPATIGLVAVALDQLVANGALMWATCTKEVVA